MIVEHRVFAKPCLPGGRLASGRALPPPMTPGRIVCAFDALGIAHRTYPHPPVSLSRRRRRCAAVFRTPTARASFSRTRRAGSGSHVCSRSGGSISRSWRPGRWRRVFPLAAPPISIACLGVRPGSVTPFALLNDVRHLVTPVLDAAMLECDPLNYHPLQNDRTTAISAADLLRLIYASGHVAPDRPSGRHQARAGYPGS